MTALPTNCANPDCGVLLYHGRSAGGPRSDTAYTCDGDDCPSVICYTCLERGHGYCQAAACQSEAAAVDQWIVDTLGPRGAAPPKAGEP